jgi:dihydroorotase
VKNRFQAFAFSKRNLYRYDPAGATTNSEFGVTDVNKCRPALEAMAELGLVLEVHGEVTHGSVVGQDKLNPVEP